MSSDPDDYHYEEPDDPEPSEEETHEDQERHGWEQV